MIAVALIGLIAGGMLEAERRRRRFLRIYREQALAEFEWSMKVRIVTGNMGFKGIYHPSLAEIASMWDLDTEERRLLEGEGEDILAVMKDAGWASPKAIPVSIDLTETVNTGRLRKLLRGEDWHRRMRRKYRWAARHPWLPVGPDPADRP